MKKYNIAVVGATGNVGRKILEILDEREFPINNIYALASKSSGGKKVSFGDNTLTIETLDNFDFKKTDIVFSCVSSTVTKSYIDRPLEENCIIIDKSSLFRMEKDIPLIVPEVNEHLVHNMQGRKIIASPNCVVIPLVVALSPLDAAAKIKRIVLSTYQSVSGAGKEYMDELYNQTKSTFMPNKEPSRKFERQIAFNIIPKIDIFNSNGDSLEEQKICEETKKILGPQIEVSATSVRVPVFVGHSISVNIQFEKNITAEEVEEILSESEGVTLISKDGEARYITPVEAVGEDTVYVSRVRDDLSTKNSLNLWIVSDNLRKGAATNAVQIAEVLKGI